MQQPKRYLITSALPYANGYKHIGHLAGAYLPADTYVRYLRAQQRDVVFVCGSDEHGTAIPIQAAKENTTPRAIIDKYHEICKKNFEDLGISFDIYHRTSEPLHHETSQEFFTYLNDRNEFQVFESEQYYDEEARTFLADRYIKGTCPNCGFNQAYGDQCEKCGKTLSPDELINPVSTLSGMTPVKRPTKHWYLPLDKHEGFLRKWILEEHGNDWKANVVGQCKSWIDGGLLPRAVTRDLDWGIKVPLTDAEGKVLYVWFDAPIGYISATKQWAINAGKDWKPYWYDKDTSLVHFIGKDNIVFHSIIFPVMLNLHGNILPSFVAGNEFMNLEGDKMSTSRNWKIDMQDYIDDFVNKDNGGEQTVDMLRYYLTQIAPESKDSEFTWKGFQDAVNNELVSVFANFVNRTMVLMHKLTSGKVPKLHEDVMDDKDRNMLAGFMKTKEVVEDCIEHFRFREGLFEVIELSRKGNRYMQEKEPWILARNLETNPENQKIIDNCLHVCLQLSANLAIFINPWLPSTSKKMLHMFKVVEKILFWENAGKQKLLSPGYSLREPSLLFRKVEDDEIKYQVEKLKSNAKPSTAVAEVPVEEIKPEMKAEIVYDDFAKISLFTGKILSATKVKKADKLLQLEVDLGFEKRTILSGIAEHFEPDSIIGQQVVVVANLAPRKMKGIESNGMILMAEDSAGKLYFVQPAQEIAAGAKVS
ncbi:methionine--tRNA ligase [Pollutibacter soli]|uniref:methionine--tRNA ligase n=1 Tax=Pollutibacter soli TaxID=3034157 RepID=UPI003013EB08